MNVLDRAFPGWSETPDGTDAEIARIPVGGSYHHLESARMSHRLMPDLYPEPDGPEPEPAAVPVMGGMWAWAQYLT